jgi:nucleoside-diphosphate-sugar epimerase
VVPDENEADLTNPDSLCGVIQVGDIVINSAGYANATDTTEHGKALFRSVNIDGVRNLAEVCVERGVAQLVHISSVAAMGRWHREGVTEEMMIPVHSPYAESKRQGENVLEEYRDRLPITVLRPTSVFGEGRGLARTLCSVVSRGIVPLPGGGSARIPFTYVGNIAQCVELSLGNSKCFGRTFIIGDDESYALRDIVTGLAEALNVNARIVPVPVTLARCGVKCATALFAIFGRPPILDSGRLETLTTSISYSIAAFQEATGYQPAYSVQHALGLIGDWYASKKD